MDEWFGTAASSLAWALIDFLWQGLLVGWVAALLLALMRKARPQARYLVACGALLLCAALPLAGMIARMAEADAGAASSGLPVVAASAMAGAVSALSVSAIDAGRFAGWANWELALQERLPLVLLLWALGAGLLALRMVLGLAWVRRRTRAGQYRLDPAWQARLDRMARGMGIARRVTLGLVDDLASPVTAGWWRPVVLVPASLVSGMPPQLLEALLAHELAHVRRCDYVVNLIQSAIEILLFYHPAVWWLSNRIREEREQIADDVAASTLGEPRRLALALSELDLFQFTPQLAPAAHGGNLMSRIKRLVRPEAEPLNWKLALPILGLATAAAFYSWSAPAHAEAGQPAPAPRAEPAPRPQAAPAERRVVRKEGREEPYAVVRANDKNTSMTGSSDDWDDIKEAKRRIGGDFLWFREGGQAWYIQDAGVLAKVDAAWAPMNRLGAQMDVVGKEMDVHGKKMDALGKDMDVAARGFKPDEDKLRVVEERMEALGEEMEKLGKQLGATDSVRERERIQGRMSEVGQQMSAAGQEIGQLHNGPGMREAQKSMDAIGRRMSEAGKPMDAIGKKMGALGKEMERESKAADKTVRALIREAREKGLAKPVPQAG
ncbi:M56 family metallopeptidase [Massilia varians]|uniref:M56 family metallopeptidase n=1 Tax=Massilia varians TaxID=457921 RepID=UPI00255595BD|nr:M56 family metallopeptidase [Massilia varians]MDK6076365.1 M56 family metallopeptidase [Massilia varians]